MRAPKWSGARLALAPVLLFTVRFDGGMRAVHVHAAVKTQPESEQTRELQACTRLEQRRQRLHIGAAGGSTRTLARLFPRASPLGERCSVVDTVPKATRTPPRVPIRVRAEKSPLSSVSPRGNGEWRGAPDGEELRAVRCVWSHRPCIELLYRSYSQRF